MQIKFLDILDHSECSDINISIFFPRKQSFLSEDAKINHIKYVKTIYFV